MNKIKFYMLLSLARIVSLCIKVFGKSSGTSFVGMLILKINPNFITDASKYVNKYITITGTNGKTTTAGFLSHILKSSNNSVLHNSKGANMLTGIANVFALSVSPFKKFDFSVLESDEAYLSKLYDHINSDYLVVTNLFRDQLDRYGELASTANKIQEAIDKNRDLQLILNADDPLVVKFKGLGSIVPIYYGFDKVEYAYNNIASNAPAEQINCPLCDRALIYNERYFAQQGDYYCRCGYCKPKCKYSAQVIIYKSYSEITISHSSRVYKFNVPLTGLYNAYNALAAIATSFELGITNLESIVSSFHSEFGRSEVRKINGVNTIIQLIKNPTGATEVLKTVDLNSQVLIIINDDYADGRDVSWLWDADFELLKSATSPIITSGKRAYDMAIRLKYAGINNIKVISNIDDAMKSVCSKNQQKNVTILPTYTALLHIKEKGS